jgi:hypothetical protein
MRTENRTLYASRSAPVTARHCDILCSVHKISLIDIALCRDSSGADGTDLGNENGSRDLFGLLVGVSQEYYYAIFYHFSSAFSWPLYIIPSFFFLSRETKNDVILLKLYNRDAGRRCSECLKSFNRHLFCF